MVTLTNTASVITALGGVKAVAELTGRDYDAAWNWKKFRHFPPDTYLVMTEALRTQGHDAPPSLWRMVENAS